jgi:hypothetical protein
MIEADLEMSEVDGGGKRPAYTTLILYADDRLLSWSFPIYPPTVQLSPHDLLMSNLLIPLAVWIRQSRR